MTPPNTPISDDGGWCTIDSAPKDGTEVIVRVPGHGDYRVRWQAGFYGEDGGGGATWVCFDDRAPVCWTDGVCWQTNEDDKPSKKPKYWRPISPPSVKE